MIKIPDFYLFIKNLFDSDFPNEVPGSQLDTAHRKMYLCLTRSILNRTSVHLRLSNRKPRNDGCRSLMLVSSLPEPSTELSFQCSGYLLRFSAQEFAQSDKCSRINIDDILDSVLFPGQ